MKQQIGIKILAYRDANQDIVNKAKNKFTGLFVHDHWNFSDNETDILYFATGGSEAEAIKYIRKTKFVLLIAFSEDNAYAAATEVKAYCDQIGCDSVLLSLDDPESLNFIHLFASVRLGIKRLIGKRLGLIGHVSDWLVASDVSRKLLKQDLGIETIQIPWEKVNSFKNLQAPEYFIEKYQSKKLDTEDAGRVKSALDQTINEYNLDAITVECFSLVNENQVTACLALSDLNDDNFAAGCEGDMTSIVGIMILQQLTGMTPWMANLAKIINNSVIFAHCTAPTTLMQNFEIDTHFETGEGTAISGDFKENYITIVRFNSSFDTMFIASGEVIARPMHPGFCRTQIEVKINEQEINILKNKPLGNHHLILPGNYTDKIKLFARIMGIKKQSV